MRFIKIMVIVLFVISASAFGFSVVKDIQNYDDTIPELTSDIEVLELSCQHTQSDLLQGLHAYDGMDGDLTNDILVGSGTRFIEKGVYNLTYVVFDSHNQSASLTRKVHLTDYVSPSFTLTQPLVYRESEGNYQETMNRLGVTDMIDGDLKEFMTQVESDVNYSKAGDYHMQMEVTNSMGDTTSIALPVHIVDEETHRLNIALSQGIVYINPNETINPSEYVVSLTDTTNNTLDTSMIQIDSQLDTSTPGVYEVHYSVTDALGNIGESWLTVVVREV